MEKPILRGRDLLIYLSLKYNGDWERIYSAVKVKEAVEADDVLTAIKTVKSRTMTIIDEDYPEALKGVYKPPFVLYYYGDMQKLDNRTNIAVLLNDGDSNDHAQQMVEITQQLSECCNIVTLCDDQQNETLAKQAMPENALIGIGQCGIEMLKERYAPSEMENSQLLISEYPASSAAKRTNKSWATRIASAFGEMLLVADNTNSSNEAIAIWQGLYQDKTIMTLTPIERSDKGIQPQAGDAIIHVRNASDIIGVIETKHWALA